MNDLRLYMDSDCLRFPFNTHPPARKWKVGHKIMPLVPLRGHDTEDKGGGMETIITGGISTTLLSPIIITIL